MARALAIPRPQAHSALWPRSSAGRLEMLEGKQMIDAVRQAAAICLATIILGIAPLHRAHAAQHTAGKAAASEEEATPPQIAELTALLADPKDRLLLTLLADPTVQKWLEKQGLPKVAASAQDKSDESVSEYFG